MTKFIRVLLCWLIFGLILLVSCGIVSSAEMVSRPEIQKAAHVEKLVSHLEKRYAHQSFSARFLQTSVLAALETAETARGRVKFSHPGKMRWTYTLPELHEIITDGKKVWIWRPEQNQVMYGDASAFFASGVGATFLSDMSTIRTSYDIYLMAEDESGNEPWAELELIPKKNTPEIKRIIVQISTISYDILRVTTYNTYDDSTCFDFEQILFEPVSETLFSFHPPPGTEMIPMN